MKRATAKELASPLTPPALKRGEKYIGAILGAGGKGHHVVLLAGDTSAPWKDALDWAKKKGGDLPDRVEQALLFRDHKAEFKADWYWSNMQDASDASYAWIQGFSGGGQPYGHTSNKYRARAVRRVPIQ